MNEGYFNFYLFIIIMIIIIALCIILMECLSKFKNKLHDETMKINNDELRNIANFSINELNKLIKTVVISIEQETASELRKRIKSGDKTVSRENLCNLKNEAFNRINKIAEDSLIENSKIIIDDINNYIYDRISYEVYNLKNNGS